MGQSKFKLILNIRHLKAFFALFLFVFYAHAEAACSDKRYWVATDDGSDKFWHDTANWSCISGGPGGASAPNNTGLSAIFDNKSSKFPTPKASTMLWRYRWPSTQSSKTASSLQRTCTLSGT